MGGFTRDAASLMPGDDILVWVLPVPSNAVPVGQPSRIIGCWLGRLVAIGRPVNDRVRTARAILTDPLLLRDPDVDMQSLHGTEPRFRYEVFDPRLARRILARAYQRYTRLRVTLLMR